MDTDEGVLSEADRDAIVATATDYIASWLEGDAHRMARALHPDLAKRSVDVGPSGRCVRVTSLTAQDMIAATAEGRGTKNRAGHEVKILDASGGIASVKVTSVPYVDYLQVARFDDRWLIVNVLWRPRVFDGRGR